MSLSPSLPGERLAHISSDVAGLKNELRAAARRETDEVKSRLKPNSAHKVLHSTYVFQIRLHVTKVYAWRDLLEEREQKSAAYKSTKVNGLHRDSENRNQNPGSK